MVIRFCAIYYNHELSDIKYLPHFAGAGKMVFQTAIQIL